MVIAIVHTDYSIVERSVCSMRKGKRWRSYLLCKRRRFWASVLTHSSTSRCGSRLHGPIL